MIAKVATFYFYMQEVGNVNWAVGFGLTPRTMRRIL